MNANYLREEFVIWSFDRPQSVRLALALREIRSDCICVYSRSFAAEPGQQLGQLERVLQRRGGAHRLLLPLCCQVGGALAAAVDH